MENALQAKPRDVRQQYEKQIYQLQAAYGEAMLELHARKKLKEWLERCESWFGAYMSSYGLQQEFITPHCPQQNGMVERLIRTLKEQCTHRYRFESLQHANRVLSDWIQFYNEQRPHQALGMKTPTEVYRLSLWLVQKVLGHYIHLLASELVRRCRWAPKVQGWARLL